MTMCDDVQAQLSLMVDGQQPERSAQAMVRSHLESCAACRSVLQDLEKLRRAASALGPMAPPDHVWLEVAGQIHLSPAPTPAAPEPEPRSPARTAMYQWIGLAAALVLVTGGYYVVEYLSPQPGTKLAGNAAPSGTVEAVTEELSLAAEHYDKAVAELEAMAKADSSVLDPALASSLRQDLQTIDAAIAESRGALAQNPGSEPARESLFEALRRKVTVLQATVTLINEMRKGNQAEAGRLIRGLNQ